MAETQVTPGPHVRRNIYLVFSKKHRRFKLNNFLDFVGLTQYYEPIIGEGAENLHDLLNVENSDIDELCRNLKMKMFEKIRLKHALKMFRDLCERYPEVPSRVRSKRRFFSAEERAERARQAEERRRIREEKRKRRMMKARDYNDVSNIDVTDALIKHSLLPESAIGPNQSSLLLKNLCDAHKIYGKNKDRKLTVYHEMINKAAGVCAYHFPEKAAEGNLKFREFVEAVVRMTDYKYCRPYVKRPSGYQQRRNKKLKELAAAGIDPSTVLPGKPGRPKRMNPDGTRYVTKKELRRQEVEKRRYERELKRVKLGKPARGTVPGSGVISPRSRSRSRSATPRGRSKTPQKKVTGGKRPRSATPKRARSQSAKPSSRKTPRPATPSRQSATPSSSKKATQAVRGYSRPRSASRPTTKSPTPAQIRASKPTRVQCFENRNFIEITSSLLVRMTKDLESAVASDDFENALRLREGIVRAEKELLKLNKEKARLAKQLSKEIELEEKGLK
eukprot:Nk52_evm2s387 gene=Nk52_evmTU2s387